MDAAPGVKGYANYAVGYDNLDVPAATQRRIPLSNTPGVLTDATADMAWALLFAIARRVVKRIPAVDASVVVEQVAAAIDHMARPADATIRIHPDDRELAEQAMPEMAQACEHLQHVHWVDDATIERGGCVVSAGRGRIDAQLATQLDRVIEQLLPAGSDRSDDRVNEG
jgi:hypothetical protein